MPFEVEPVLLSWSQPTIVLIGGEAVKGVAIKGSEGFHTSGSIDLHS